MQHTIIYYLLRCHIIREKSSCRCSRKMLVVMVAVNQSRRHQISTAFALTSIKSTHRRRQMPSVVVVDAVIHIIYFCRPLKCLPNVLSNFDGQACRLCQSPHTCVHSPSQQIHMRYRDIAVRHFSQTRCDHFSDYKYYIRAACRRTCIEHEYKHNKRPEIIYHFLDWISNIYVDALLRIVCSVLSVFLSIFLSPSLSLCHLSSMETMRNIFGHSTIYIRFATHFVYTIAMAVCRIIDGKITLSNVTFSINFHHLSHWPRQWLYASPKLYSIHTSHITITT